MSSTQPGEWVAVEGPARRRILSHIPEMMVVEVEFEAGGCGPEHSHPHLQATYVRSGRFAFTIDGEPHEVAAGESLIIPSNAMHLCRCVEAGTLVDVFSPAREDFLAK